jgi:DNA-directed RNA polymerase subunit E'/Rpb7
VLKYITKKSKKINKMAPNINDTIRISIGYFQEKQTEQVEAMLQNEFKNTLIPAIEKLHGNLGYYVAIDREKHAMQMATLKEMLDMRATFEALGLEFLEITNHDLLWKLP